jgi:hypothetical protein
MPRERIGGQAGRKSVKLLPSGVSRRAGEIKVGYLRWSGLSRNDASVIRCC